MAHFQLGPTAAVGVTIRAGESGAYCSSIDRVTSGRSLIATCFFIRLNLFPLKILNGALVSFGCFSSSESSEIAPSARAGILFAGV